MGFKRDIRQRLLDLEQENSKNKSKIEDILTKVYNLEKKVKLYEYIFKELDIQICNSDEFAALQKILSKNELNQFKSHCCFNNYHFFSFDPNDYWYFRKLKKGKK